MADNDSNNKRVRVDSDESPIGSPEAKRLRPDLLEILDDLDFTGGDRDPATQDLATVMRILEEEISPASLPEASTSDSGDSQPVLGYLLEASDDELGLPPAASSSAEEEEESVDVFSGEAEAVGFGGVWGFDDDIPSYDVLEIGFPQVEMAEGSVLLEGLFDYPDFVSDFSEFSWRHGSVPTL